MNDILIYTTDDGLSKVELQIENGTAWLSQAEMAELFQTTTQNIGKHIKSILSDEELDEKVVVNYQFHTTQHGAMTGVTQSHQIAYYNLDMILAIGYRVHSPRGIQFRKFASSVLKEYLEKGFAMNDEKLKELGGGSHWHELLDRIRDIRSSEKVMYRQVLDLFAEAADYDPKSSESLEFFKMVQNKLHYAAHGNTAAEVIYNRADAEKEFMGLQSFTGKQVKKKDTEVAKNYLNDKELRVLNNIVSGYFDFAENRAIEHEVTYMKDYIRQLDRILAADDRELLEGNGTVSHQQAIEKAHQEYQKYQQRTLSEVEKAYLDTISGLEKEAKKNSKDGINLKKLEKSNETNNYPKPLV